MPDTPFSGDYKYIPTMDSLSAVVWQTANFMTTAGITSVAVTMVQSPLDSLRANWTNTQRVFPACAGLALVRFLYTGLAPGLASSGVRTAYVTTAKNAGSSAEKDTGEKRSIWTGAAYAIMVALGEVIITQLPETKKDLLKFGVVPGSFCWQGPHNRFKLAKLGCGARLATTSTNFFSLCVGEEYGSLASSGGCVAVGALSGMTAALVSHPFVYYRSIILRQVTTKGEQLEVPSLKEVVAEAKAQVKKEGILPSAKKCTKGFVADLKGNVPLRMASTALTFVALSGVSRALGAYPLARWGLFSSLARVSEEEVLKPSCRELA
jgi:hypothetical protein